MESKVVLLVDPDPRALAASERTLRRAGVDFISSVDLSEALRYVDSGHVVRAAVLDASVARLDQLVHTVQTTSQRIPFIICVQEGESRGVSEALDAARWHDLVEIVAVIEKPLSEAQLLEAVLAAPKPGPREVIEPWDDVEISEAEPSAYISEGFAHDEEQDEDPTVIENLDSLVPRELLLELYQTASDSPPPQSIGSNTELRMRAALLAQRVLSFLPKKFFSAQENVFDLTGAMTRACELALAERDLDQRDTIPASAESATVQTRNPLRPAITGDIAYISVDQVIQMAAMLASPTSLQIERDGRKIEIFFDGSSIVFARQVNLREDFLLGRFIADTGAITQHDLEAILKQRTGMPIRLGEQLQKLGWIGKDDLDVALRRQTAEIVYEALRWSKGRFDIQAQPLPPEAEEAKLSLPVQHLLLEGVRRLDEWKRMTGDTTEFPN